jgi:hypothetical protein
MKTHSRPKIMMICCSVLQAEIETLCYTYWPDHDVRFLPSMMHMHPEQLAASLESVLDKELRRGHGVVLVYGDCCAQMTELEARPGVARTQGKNCCELLLGPEEYRRLSHEGAFFLIPEWARRWKEIFARELGLDQATATSLMRDIHRTLTYLDTGLVPAQENALKECSAYCGLPYEIRPVSLEPLRLAIQAALLRCIPTGATK